MTEARGTFQTSSIHYHGNLSKTQVMTLPSLQFIGKNQASECVVQDLILPSFISSYAPLESPGPILCHTFFSPYNHSILPAAHLAVHAGSCSYTLFMLVLLPQIQSVPCSVWKTSSLLSRSCFIYSFTQKTF